MNAIRYTDSEREIFLGGARPNIKTVRGVRARPKDRWTGLGLHRAFELSQHCGVRSATLAISNSGAPKVSSGRSTRSPVELSRSSTWSSFGRDAPLSGDSWPHRSRKQLGPRSAPSTDRITSGCTRRRRANLVYVQTATNRWRRRQYLAGSGITDRLHSGQNRFPKAIKAVRGLSRSERTRGAAGEPEALAWPTCVDCRKGRFAGKSPMSSYQGPMFGNLIARRIR